MNSIEFLLDFDTLGDKLKYKTQVTHLSFSFFSRITLIFTNGFYNLSFVYLITTTTKVVLHLIAHIAVFFIVLIMARGPIVLH